MHPSHFLPILMVIMTVMYLSKQYNVFFPKHTVGLTYHLKHPMIFFVIVFWFYKCLLKIKLLSVT